MAFSLNPALSHVAIDESSLYEVYRSVDRQVPTDHSISRRECEAFICSSQENGVTKLYVAFWEVNTRRTIVLIPNAKSKGMKDYPDLLDEAKRFLAKQGFILEQVNLDFSVAMRQTIMKAIRVLQPAKQPATIRNAVATPVTTTPPSQASPALEPTRNPAPALPDGAVKEANLLAAVAPSVTAATVAAATVTAVATAELTALSATVGHLQAKIKEVEQRSAAKALELERELEAEQRQRQEAQARLSELASLREKLTAREVELERQALARQGELDSLQEKLAAREADLERLANSSKERHKADHDRLKTQTALADQVAALQEELTAGRRNLEQMSLEKVAAVEARQQATAEKTALEQELAAERKMRQEAKLQGDDMALLQRRLAEQADELAGIKQKLEEAHDGLTLLRTENGAILRDREELAGRLVQRDEEMQKVRTQLTKEQQSVKKLDRQLTDSRAAADQAQREANEELGRLRETKETLEQAIVELLAVARTEQETLSVELAALRQELARQHSASEILAAESRKREDEVQKREDEARAEIARLREELRIQEDAANREQAALRSEIRRVIAEHTVAGGAPPPEPVPEVAISQVEPEADGPYRSPTALEYAALLEADDDGPAAYVEIGETESYTVFVRDDLLGGSGWNSDGGGSSGTQFSPDRTLSAIPCPSPEALVALFESVNKVQAAPDGYEPQKCGGYVSVIKCNGVAEVYLAWFMEESRTVQVCRPCPPTSEGADLEQIVRDAVFYFESAGLMMEPVELGAPKKRDRHLKRIPVFASASIRSAEVAASPAVSRVRGAI